MSNHQFINLPGAIAPRGYSDATLAASGRVLYLGGHVSYDSERRLVHPGDIVAQVDLALKNLRGTLEAAGATPQDLVRMVIHCTDVPAYRRERPGIGEAWRRQLGKAYPAMMLLGVVELYDEEALVEIDGIAVIPNDS